MQNREKERDFVRKIGKKPDFSINGRVAELFFQME